MKTTSLPHPSAVARRPPSVLDESPRSQRSSPMYRWRLRTRRRSTMVLHLLSNPRLLPRKPKHLQRARLQLLSRKTRRTTRKKAHWTLPRPLKPNQHRSQQPHRRRRRNARDRAHVSSFISSRSSTSKAMRGSRSSVHSTRCVARLISISTKLIHRLVVLCHRRPQWLWQVEHDRRSPLRLRLPRHQDAPGQALRAHPQLRPPPRPR